MQKQTQKLKRIPDTGKDWRETPDGKWFSYRDAGKHSLFSRQLDEHGKPIHGGNDEWQFFYDTVAEMNAVINQDGHHA